MSTETENVLRFTHRFDAAPEKVFDCWVDPEKVKRWFFFSPFAESMEYDLDIRPGGSYRVVRREKGEFTAIGEYLEIEPPRRIVFTFSMPQFSPDVAPITIEIAPDGDGTLLTFTEVGLPADEHEATVEGWRMMFNYGIAALVA
jgi:uncharacterized protein YndB with AHSA1/START domain